jgi:hypothetical protein
MINNQNKLTINLGWESFCWTLYTNLTVVGVGKFSIDSLQKYVNGYIHQGLLTYDLLDYEDASKLFELIVNQLKANNKLIVQQEKQDICKIYLA